MSQHLLFKTGTHYILITTSLISAVCAYKICKVEDDLRILAEKRKRTKAKDYLPQTKMSCQEQQEEEVEVLQSIYEGDANFKQPNTTTYQYKYGEEGGFQTFLLELQWGENYPEEAPVINLDLFYNKHVVDSVKDAIRDGLEEQIVDLLGMPMTFTLFEWVKDNLDNLLKAQPNTPAPQTINEPALAAGGGGDEKGGAKKEKKDQLSKHQKRRMYDKFGGNMDDRPRGWNWVDVVKHLSQTGGKPDTD